MTVRNRMVVAAVVVALVLGLSATCFSQTFYMQPIPEQKAKFGVRYMRPNLTAEYDRYLDPGLLNGGHDFFANVPVSRSLNLIGSMTLAIADYSTRRTYAGNFLLGLQARVKTGGSWGGYLTTGITFPTAEYGAYYLGFLMSPYEMHRSIPDYWVLHLNLAFHRMPKDRVAWLGGFETGVQMYRCTENYRDRTEFCLNAALTAGVKMGHVAVRSELATLFLVTGNDHDENVKAQLAFGIQLLDYQIRPGLWYHLLLSNDAEGIYDGVLGIKLEFAPF